MKNISKRVQDAHGLNDETAEHWNNLDTELRRRYYEEAVADVRHSTLHENAFGKIVRGTHGPGSALAEAAMQAYATLVTAPKEKEERQVRRYAEMAAEAEAFHRGYAIVNGTKYPLSDCPDFIRESAARIAAKAESLGLL